MLRINKLTVSLTVVTLSTCALAGDLNLKDDLLSSSTEVESTVKVTPAVPSIFDKKKTIELTESELLNIETANGNTASSQSVLTKKHGTGSAIPVISETPTDELIRDNSTLKMELERTKSELNKAKTQIAITEKMYGEIPDGSSAPAIKDNTKIPAVPKDVMTNGVPKYNANGGNDGTNITVTPGVNQVITISTDQPNRIITPFAKPQILSSALQGGTGKECGEVCVKGNVVYISTKKEYPLGLFITDKNNEQTAISLTLVPRRIPPREVSLILSDNASVTVSGTPEAEIWETSQPFVNSIKKSLLATALGEVPSGYNLQKIPGNYSLPLCSQNGLNFNFEKGQLLAGSNLNFVIGRVTNVSNREIEILETSCGGYDVAAVASFPNTLLKPAQTSEIYVVQRKNAKEKVKTVKRRSLVGNW